MNYAYGAMWLVIAVILLFKMTKENKIFYLLGGYFVFLGGWWIADAALPTVDLFKGNWDIALKVISGVVLVIVAVFYYKNFYKKGRK